MALSASETNVRNYDVMSAGVLIGALPPLLVYFFGGKYFVRGLTRGRSSEGSAMATLTIRNVRKTYGAVEVLKGIDLEAATASSSRWSAPRAAASPRCSR